MKKFLFILLCILAGAQTVKAQKAYAFFYEDQQVLKFFYDNEMTVRLTDPQQRPDNYYTAFYSLATEQQPQWYWDNNNAKIKAVNFDSSFKDYKPTRLSYFIQKLLISALKRIFRPFHQFFPLFNQNCVIPSVSTPCADSPPQGGVKDGL